MSARKTFEIGQEVEFAVDTWSEGEPWRRGRYDGKVESMRGHHTISIPGETRELDLTAYGHGVRRIPASWTIPTRRIRAVKDEAET